MIEVGKAYKFEIVSKDISIFYTGTVLDFDKKLIKVKTFRNEVVGFGIDKIVQFKQIGDVQ